MRRTIKWFRDCSNSLNGLKRADEEDSSRTMQVYNPLEIVDDVVISDGESN